MRRHSKSVITFATVTAMVATSAFAQSTDADGSDRCRVSPDVDSNQRAFADKLDDCNSVLKPPRVGDTEITTPAPDVGKTPVIRPGELPPQQSSADGG